MSLRPPPPLLQGDRAALSSLADTSLAAGKHNVTFLCLFLLGQVRGPPGVVARLSAGPRRLCLHLLLHRCCTWRCCLNRPARSLATPLGAAATACRACAPPHHRQVERCVSLLVESGRLPEAAMMARTYAPSLMAEPVKVRGWRVQL